MSATLERAGYQLCEFTFEEGEDCLGCDRLPGAGAPQYYIRTSWDCEEGDYYCRRCAFHRATGREWDVFPAIRRLRPMHGGGWAYLHGQKDADLLIWSGR